MPAMRTLFFCVALLSIMAGPVRCRVPFNKEACDRGTKCSQCAEGSYLRMPIDDGRESELLCCPGCANSTMFFSTLSRNPSCYCMILDLKDSRNFRFPESFGHTRNDLAVASSSQDTNYILNKGAMDSRALREALGLMAYALEDLDARITKVENHLSLSENSGVNRLGLSEGPPGPCPNANYTRDYDTGRCYYVSVINKDRKSWEDASASCESMGATLAEPRGEFFNGLSKYLSKNGKTAGHSFWIGGIFLDSWRWIYSSEKVSLSSYYWVYRDPEGNAQSPGDIAGGRCLAFRYISDQKYYAYSADECPKEKFYACELLEKRHRNSSS